MNMCVVAGLIALCHFTVWNRVAQRWPEHKHTHAFLPFINSNAWPRLLSLILRFLFFSFFIHFGVRNYKQTISLPSLSSAVDIVAVCKTREHSLHRFEHGKCITKDLCAKIEWSREGSSSTIAAILFGMLTLFTNCIILNAQQPQRQWRWRRRRRLLMSFSSINELQLCLLRFLRFE